MKDQRCYGLKMARERIIAFIRSHGLKHGAQLPTIARLVEITGLSRGTVWKAMQELRDQQIVEGVSGHPFCVGPQGVQAGEVASPLVPPLEQSAFQTTAWHRVKSSILKDVIDGVHPPGVVLPANKELRRRYGVCFRTLQKALKSLEDQGIIEPYKKGYRVPAFSARGWKPRVVCMARSVDESAIVLTSQHDENFFRTLEHQCRISGIDIDTYLLISEPDFSGYHLKEVRTGREFDMNHFSVCTDAAVLGFVLLAPWYPGTLDRVVAQAVKPLGKPLAVLDGTGNIANAQQLGLDPSRFRSFAPTISAQAGVAVGRYAIELGYHEIAFISANHNFLWSQQRLLGLIQAYAQAEYSQGVLSFTVPGLTETWSVAPPYDTTAIHSAYESWKTVIPALYRLDVDQHMVAFDQKVHTTGFRRQLYELFEKALERKNIRAWVTVNDATGVMALQFLAHHRIRVPGDIAIISFDNFVEAMQNNLTSYDFNLQATAVAALGFILRRKPYHDTTCIDGFIAPRLSTSQS